MKFLYKLALPSLRACTIPDMMVSGKRSLFRSVDRLFMDGGGYWSARVGAALGLLEWKPNKNWAGHSDPYVRITEKGQAYLDSLR